MKRILVTGANGFIGANLVNRLAFNDDYKVHVLFHNNGHRIFNLKGRVKQHVKSLTYLPEVYQLINEIRPHWVFHLAANGVSGADNNQKEMVSTNVQGTINLLDVCVQYGVESFIHTGSSLEYGFKSSVMEESDILAPDSLYGITKAAATHYCNSVSLNQNINAVTLRVFSAYGPFEGPTRLFNKLINQGLKGELPTLVSPDVARDFVYINDVVDALVMAASTNVPRGSIFNVCSGKQTTIKEVVETAIKIMNIDATPVYNSNKGRQWDTTTCVGNNAKIKAAIGWQPKTSFEDGLKLTIDWFKAHV